MSTRWSTPGVCLALAVLCLSACEPTSRAPAETPRAAIPLNHLPALAGDYFRLDSQATGRPYHIYVALPSDYDPDADTRYPAVYVLDGDSLFPILAPTHLFLNFDENLPQAVVIGIAYGSFDSAVNRRGLDYTPPAPDARPDQGGAPAFHEFLEAELIPEIERRFAVDPSRRILFGQSRGGQFVLYSAFTDPDLFWGRIASNPAFDPGRDMFFAPAEPATRDDLGLVLTSGSRDRPELRQAAMDWQAAWSARDDAPWAINVHTIEGGTHAADSANSYRAGMLWLFGRDQPPR